MSTPKHEHGARDPLLEDLGRLARQERAGDQAESCYEPLPEDAVQAILDRVLGPASEDPRDGEPSGETQDGPPVPPDPQSEARGQTLGDTIVPQISTLPRDAANERHWLRHGAGYMLTAVAAAAVTVVFMREPASPDPVVPAFESWGIVGGSARPAHQGPLDPSSRVCMGRRMQLRLAVAPGASTSPRPPVELVIDATSKAGLRHRISFLESSGDALVRWSGDGQALLFHGTPEQLALSTTTWELRPQVGPPGACEPTGHDPRCTTLEPRAIDVAAKDRCDDGP